MKKRSYKAPCTEVIHAQPDMLIATSLQSTDLGIGWGGNTSEADDELQADVKTNTMDWNDIWE